MLNGQGQCIWENKKIYVGEWLNNKMSGYGSYTWPDGMVYKGFSFYFNIALAINIFIK